MTFVDVARRIEEASSASYPPDILGPQSPPTLTTLAPSSIVVNTPTPCTVTGTGFNHNAVILVDGVGQFTTWLSDTQVSYLAEASAVGSQDVRARNGPSAPSALLVMTVTATQEEPVAAQQTVPTEPEPEPAPEPEAPKPPDGGGMGGGTAGPRKRAPKNGG